MLQQILDVNKPKSDLKKIDGTNFGCPYTGYYDQPFILLQKLLGKFINDSKSKDSQKKNELMATIN